MAKGQREYSTIPIRESRKKVVEKLRVTEYKALTGDSDKPQYDSPIEQLKHAAILEADAEAARLCAKRLLHLYGAARVSWVAARAGVTILEAKKVLSK